MPHSLGEAVAPAVRAQGGIGPSSAGQDDGPGLDLAPALGNDGETLGARCQSVGVETRQDGHAEPADLDLQDPEDR